MKYLWILMFLIVQHLSKEIIIDLDQQSRLGSEFLKELKWSEDPEIPETPDNMTPRFNTYSKTNTETVFTLQLPKVEDRKEELTMSANLPSISISDGGNKGLDFSLLKAF
jgi:hypothetical protein